MVMLKTCITKEGDYRKLLTPGGLDVFRPLFSTV